MLFSVRTGTYADPAKARTRPRRLPQQLERKLVLAAKDGGDAERTKLVEAFTPLVSSVARMYRGWARIDRAELMQEGVVGLMRALERYDPALGTPFWMYASWWVRQAMQQLVSELGRPIVLSDRALRKLARIKEAQREHLQSHGQELRPHELAAATGLPQTQIESLLSADRTPRALEEPVGGDHEVGTTLGELVDDPRAEAAYEQVPRLIAAAKLPPLLEQLEEREQVIIRARFGLDCSERTLRELGNDLGVSAERVRQIEAASLAKLRDAAA
ncbi:MAG: polymerase primary sigma factor [Solirubrobacteraceae bacterium]|jgi:RNA polymerase sigma factor (sigma-70 family)|nr:polymerase primary sigma factor [Solirubrobacteraceae bacterium]